MIYPTVDTIGKGEFDRYSVTVAVAKAACLVKDEYSKQKEEAEAELEEKMDRWMYLQELAEKIEAQK